MEQPLNASTLSPQPLGKGMGKTTESNEYPSLQVASTMTRDRGRAGRVREQLRQKKLQRQIAGSGRGASCERNPPMATPEGPEVRSASIGKHASKAGSGMDSDSDGFWDAGKAQKRSEALADEEDTENVHYEGSSKEIELEEPNRPREDTEVADVKREDTEAPPSTTLAKVVDGDAHRACQEAREEESGTLAAIYGSDFNVQDDSTWVLRISEQASLRVHLPAGYPHLAPPRPTVDIAGVATPESILGMLAAKWNPGEVCIHQWAELLRDGLAHYSPKAVAMAEEVDDDHSRCPGEDDRDAAETGEDREVFTYVNSRSRNAGFKLHVHHKKSRFGAESFQSCNEVKVLHGETISDRKSKFQAHAAEVSSASQVSWVQRSLLTDDNLRLDDATHNVTAYRFRDQNGLLVSDHDDDGEANAGMKLAKLLELRGLEDIFVMVTRWRGVIQLGADRYKHYCRAAQSLLDHTGMGRSTHKESASARTGRSSASGSQQGEDKALGKPRGKRKSSRDRS